MFLMTKIAHMIDEKRHYRAYRARTRQLPAEYRATIEAVERYVMYLGPGDGRLVLTILDDLVDLFEQSAADGVPVRAVVGQQPVEFVEAFLDNYPRGNWIVSEQERLNDTIARAVTPTAVPGTDTGADDPQ